MGFTGGDLWDEINIVLKIDGWEGYPFLLGRWPIFRRPTAVSFTNLDVPKSRDVPY